MKKRTYILAIAATAAVAMLAGCGDKKQEDGAEAPADNAAEASDEILDFKALDYVKLGDYKGLEATYPSVLEVTDEDVQMRIDETLEENIEYREVKDRAAKEGDTVNIDYTGTIDGEEFEGGSDSGYDLELGSGEFLDEFETSLEGKKAGETAVFKMTFPKDYDEEIAGKEAEFTVKVNSISETVRPKYDTDFVKSVSDCKTTKEYEASVKAQLEAEAEDSSKMEAEESLLQLAIENAEVDGYPQAFYDFMYDDTVTGYKNYAELMGIDYEEFLESAMGEGDIEEMVLEQVNEYLVVCAILAQEGQELSDDEYAKLGEKMAQENDYDTLEEYEADYGATYAWTQVARQKAIDILYENAKLTEVPYEDFYADEEMEWEDGSESDDSSIEFIEDSSESDDGGSESDTDSGSEE